MSQNKNRISKIIKNLKFEIRTWRSFKVSPIDDLYTRADETEDFVRVINKLLQNSQILSSYHCGRYQQGIYFTDNNDNLIHIGYTSGKDYLLDGDLVYRAATKLTHKRYGFYYKTRGIYFMERLCDKVIKPHRRRYYKFDDGELRPCICIPRTSLYHDFERNPFLR